jgi:hypothetical protein
LIRGRRPWAPPKRRDFIGRGFADELMSRFGYNVDVITKCFLAAVLWPLDRAAHEQ